MNKRGAYFFVLDALLGGAIFLISIVIIMGSYINTPQTRYSYTQAEDLMNLMLNTKVIEFRNDYIELLYNSGRITNTEQTLFEQISEFYYTGKSEEAHNLSKIILTSVLPEQFGIMYSIIDSETDTRTILFNKSVEIINNSNFQLNTKKISFYATNETEFKGPNIVEIRIWN